MKVVGNQNIRNCIHMPFNVTLLMITTLYKADVKRLSLDANAAVSLLNIGNRWIKNAIIQYCMHEIVDWEAMTAIKTLSECRCPAYFSDSRRLC